MKERNANSGKLAHLEIEIMLAYLIMVELLHGVLSPTICGPFVLIRLLASCATSFPDEKVKQSGCNLTFFLSTKKNTE
jgi:hypothetical protein